MPEPRPTPSQVAAWAALLRSARALRASAEQALAEAGLPELATYDVLRELALAGTAGLRPRALEARLLFEQSNLSRLLARLAGQGLVTHRACPGDGRGRLVAITPAGRALRRRIWHVYGAAITRLVGARLDAAEAAALARLLLRLAPA